MMEKQFHDEDDEDDDDDDDFLSVSPGMMMMMMMVMMLMMVMVITIWMGGRVVLPIWPVFITLHATHLVFSVFCLGLSRDFCPGLLRRISMILRLLQLLPRSFIKLISKGLHIP